MNGKRLFLCLITVLLAGSFAGCGGGSDEGGSEEGKKELTLLTMQLKPTFTEYFQDLFEEFKADHPDVEIEWLDFPYEGYETKLMTSLMGRDPMDVIDIPQESMPTYVRAEHLLPLDEHLTEEQLDIYLNGIYEDSVVFDNTTYGLPWYGATDVLVINQELWEEAGLTEEDIPNHLTDLPEICRQVKENTDAYGYFPLYTEAGSLRLYYLDAGVPLFNEDRTKAAFNTPKGVKVLKLFTDLYKDELVPREALTATHRRPLELYKTRRLAALATAPQFIRQIKGDAPDIYENSIVIPRLQWPGEQRYGVSVHVLGVSNKTEHPELAAELAYFITNAKNQLGFSKQTTIYPSVKESLEAPFFMEGGDTPEDKARVIGARQIREGGVVYRPPEDASELNKVFNQTMEDVALGRKSAEEALADAEEEWNEILAE